MVETEFASRGKKLQIAFEIELGQSILGFIQSNLGISILPKIFISQMSEDVKAIPFSDVRLNRQISLLARAEAVNRQLLSLFRSS
ncbi:LysR family transcriptional regulator substrate-binding protein [Paenibacillus taihuensis]|uniref:LysR family transcriptional regulator substrate-binding protein n=1 Tax=Paenibacillus taihuensis TaxID=1156355 RepID=UPI001FE7D810